MAYVDRKSLFQKIEEVRGGRAVICFFNCDRASTPNMPGLATHFSADFEGGAV